MSEGTWLAQTRKKNKSLWIILGCVAVVAAAVVFLHNNRELLWGVKNGSRSPESKSEMPALVSTPSRDTLQNRIEPAVSTVPKQSVSNARAEVHAGAGENSGDAGGVEAIPQKTMTGPAVAKRVFSSIRLDDIVCRLADRKRTVVRLSLELRFSDEAEFSRELVVKRDNLKTMVQKVMSSKTLDDVVVETLRNEIKNGLNQIVEHGEITDVEFKQFRLDKVD